MLIRNNQEVQAIYFEQILKPDCNIVDIKGRGLIHHIVKPMDFGYFQNTNLLTYFSEKCDLNLKDKNGNPPIYYAMQQENGIMKDLLIELGADEIEIQENGVQRVQSSLLNSFNFPEIKYNFQEDYEKFNEECLEMEKRNRMIDETNRVQPHKLVTGGDFEVIYEEDVPFNAFMVKVEISHGFYSGNTFYRMQLLRDKVRGVIVLFTNWGRTGDDGQYQHTPFGTLEEGKKSLKNL